MKQLSLFDNTLALAGVLPSVKACMRRILGDDEGECRKGFVDKLNAVASQEQIPLTGGNVKVVSLDTLNKILSPSDTSHPPSFLFILAFCRAANNYEPFSIAARTLGFELMSEEDRRLRDYPPLSAVLACCSESTRALCISTTAKRFVLSFSRELRIFGKPVFLGSTANWVAK